MTVPTTAAFTGPYYGNGETTEFPFGFKVNSDSEIVVFYLEDDGTEMIVPSADYTVELSSNENNPGGTVTMAAPPANDPARPIFIALDPDFTQNTKFEDEGAFNQSILNPTFDAGALRSIWLRSRIIRACLVPFGEAGVTFPRVIERANKYFYFGPAGEILLSNGTGADGLRQDVADADLARPLISYRYPISEAIARQLAGVLDERLSILNFIPTNKHAGIRARTNFDDLSAILNADVFQNPDLNGVRIYWPEGTYNVEATLASTQHSYHYGVSGRENMDNSWSGNGDAGTRIRGRMNAGHVMSFSAPNADNNRTNVVLRDMLIQGNRLTDADAVNGAAVSGSCLYLAGGLLPIEGTRQLRYLLDNVCTYGGIDHGVLDEGNTYGSEIRYLHTVRNGYNGIRSIYGPSGGEKKIGMIRAFQNGYRGATDLNRAGGVISAAKIVADQLSFSESRGPGLMLGGIPFIGGLQLESNGLDVAAADRKQLVLGWLDNGIVHANIANLLADPGAAYQGAVIYHSAYASNVNIQGYLANALGVGGRHVEVQANVGPVSAGLIDVRKLNSSVYVDNGGTYNIISGEEVRLRHAGHDNQTGDDTLVAFTPAALYDARGSWNGNRFTAKHKMVLDVIGGNLAFKGIDRANHDRSRFYVYINGVVSRTYFFQVGTPARAGSNRLNWAVPEISIPLDAGEYVEFKYDVTGGGKTVGLEANESYLMLSAQPKP